MRYTNTYGISAGPLDSQIYDTVRTMSGKDGWVFEFSLVSFPFVTVLGTYRWAERLSIAYHVSDLKLAYRVLPMRDISRELFCESAFLSLRPPHAW